MVVLGSGGLKKWLVSVHLEAEKEFSIKED